MLLTSLAILPVVFDLLATADVWGPFVAVVIGVTVSLVSRRYLGGWPDLWRLRRVLAPLLRRSEGHEIVPEKATLELLDRECAGVVDATPREVRRAFREDSDWIPAWLASMQFEVMPDPGTQRRDKRWEVGSYARRPRGITSEWQIHVRLTSRDMGRQTALHAHRERNPWSRPVQHYRSDGWEAAPGRDAVSSWIRTHPDLTVTEQTDG